MSAVPFINHIIALGVIALQIGIVITLYFLFLKKENKWLSFVSRHALHVGFFISLASVLLSLFYSNIVGYSPCTLCWWQRIFMYPQVILFGMALYKKDRSVFRYALALSFIGIIFSLYHYYIELGGSPLVPCGVAVSCAKRYIFEFGYITIPMMGLTGFAGIITAIFTAKALQNKDGK
jgi:hypothetical protein